MRLIILTPISCCHTWLRASQTGKDATALNNVFTDTNDLSGVNSSSWSTAVILEANWHCSNSFHIIASAFWSVLAKNKELSLLLSLPSLSSSSSYFLFFFFCFSLSLSSFLLSLSHQGLWSMLQNQRICECLKLIFVEALGRPSQGGRERSSLPCAHCTQEPGSWE